MYRLIQIENKDGISQELLTELKKNKSIKIKNISETLIEIRGNNFPKELINKLNSGSNIINFDNTLYDKQDIDSFDFYYCSGQENPDKSIVISNIVEKKISDFYNLTSYCPVCKLGLIQNKSLNFKGNLSKVTEKNFITPYWSYWLVSDKLKSELEKAELSGIDYLNVYDIKNDVDNKVFQIKPSKILYNSIIADCLIPRIKYEKCNCENHTYVFKNLNRICMKKETKNDLLDFTELSERTEKTKGMYILSKKFIQELVKNGLFPDKHYQIWPITFV